MPIYEYACDSCGTRFEKLVRGSATTVQCPDCGGAKLERQYSTFAPKMGASASPQPCAPMPSGNCGMCGVPGSCKMN